MLELVGVPRCAKLGKDGFHPVPDLFRESMGTTWKSSLPKTRDGRRGNHCHAMTLPETTHGAGVSATSKHKVKMTTHLVKLTTHKSSGPAHKTNAPADFDCQTNQSCSATNHQSSGLRQSYLLATHKSFVTTHFDDATARCCGHKKKVFSSVRKLFGNNSLLRSDGIKSKSDAAK